ncbi:hypothetical protein ITJ56_17220 [Curtobacterium sp. VKM Ac-1376]|nr:hypothetical protein [Curtobacterium sp. VKM Ac-1376]
MVRHEQHRRPRDTVERRRPDRLRPSRAPERGSRSPSLAWNGAKYRDGVNHRDEARDFLSSRRAGRVVPVAAVRPELQYLLDVVTDAPAMIINNRQDIVAANALGWAMHANLVDTPARPMNFSRFIFLDPQARNFYQDWQRAAHTNVAILRREAGRTPNDKDLAALIGELSMRSDDFRELWAAHDVRRHYAGVKAFRHSVVGPMELHFQTLELAEDPGLALTIYPATPGSPTADALRVLASWAATEGIAERARQLA